MSFVNQQVIFQNLLEEFGLTKYSPKIVQECYFSRYLFPKKTPKNEEIKIKSKFGGSPIVPKDFIWPQNLGFPMSFVMQIDLAEIYQFGKKSEKNQIPDSGIIYVFWDQRQICDDFDNWQDSEKVIRKFKNAFKKLPNFMDKTLRWEKGKETRIIYLAGENFNSKNNFKKITKKFKIAKIPQELENYIFYTGCEGIVERSLIYEEYFLLPIEKLNIPSPSQLKYQYKTTNLEFETYCGIYNYWQKVYFKDSDSVKLFPNWEKSILLEIDEIGQDLPFAISLNPDLFCDYLSISLQHFDKIPNFKLDYNLEIID